MWTLTSKRQSRDVYLAWKHRKIHLGQWTHTGQPWSRIHVDFAGPINGLGFLVVVDAHS